VSQEKKLGRNHPDTLHTVAHLGMSYRGAGRLVRQSRCWKRPTGGEAPPALGWVGPELLDTYLKARKVPEAARLIDEVLAGARKTLPQDGPQLAGTLAQFGLSLLEAGGFDGPNRCSASVWRFARRPCRTGGSRSTRCPNSAGHFWARRSTRGPNRCSSRGTRDEGPREDDPAARPHAPSDALDRLIDLSTATNKPDEVKKWRLEREKYPFLAPMPREK